MDETAVERAIASGRSFTAIHLDSGFRIDVFVPPPGGFGHQQIARRVREVAITGGVSRELEVATAEDVMLAKFLWFRDGGNTSDRPVAGCPGPDSRPGRRTGSRLPHGLGLQIGSHGTSAARARRRASRTLCLSAHLPRLSSQVSAATSSQAALWATQPSSSLANTTSFVPGSNPGPLFRFVVGWALSALNDRHLDAARAGDAAALDARGIMLQHESRGGNCHDNARHGELLLQPSSSSCGERFDCHGDGEAGVVRLHRSVL